MLCPRSRDISLETDREKVIELSVELNLKKGLGSVDVLGELVHERTALGKGI